jgi:hypothetical protein
MADRALRDIQLVGSLGKTQMARGTFKSAQRIQGWQGAGHAASFKEWKKVKLLLVFLMLP